MMTPEEQRRRLRQLRVGAIITDCVVVLVIALLLAYVFAHAIIR